MNESNELTLGQVAEALWRRRGIAVLAFLLIAILGIVAWMFMPREYGSEGRLFVQVGRTNLGLDPTTAPKPVAIQDARETEIRSVMEIIKSQGVLLEVVDQVGAERILENPLDKWFDLINPASYLPASSGNSGDMDAAEYDRLKKRELAAKLLGRKMTVFLEKNSSVISIFVKANSPKLAQEVVEAIMRHTSEKHLMAHSVSGSREVFESEFKKHEQMLTEALAAQTEFRNRKGYLSIAAARGTLQSQIDKIEMDLLDVSINLSQAQKRSEELAQRLGQLDEFVDTAQQGLESSSTEGARSELFRLESEKARLLATFSEAHPKVEQVNDQLEKLRTELGKLPIERTSMAAVVNPVYAEVKVELIQQETMLEGLKARQADLLQKQQTAMASLRQLNQDESESEKLEQAIAIARRYLDVYVQKRGEAQVLEQLDQQKVSDVVVTQPAILMLKHVSPRGSIILPLVAIFATSVAVVMALIADNFQFRRERRRAAVQRQLQVPILVTLPRVASRRSVVR